MCNSCGFIPCLCDLELEEEKMIFTREQLETALDAGKLQVQVRSGRFWTARRNGKTYEPKRDPSKFYIPFKCGLRTYGRIDHYSMQNESQWRIVE